MLVSHAYFSLVLSDEKQCTARTRGISSSPAKERDWRPLIDLKLLRHIRRMHLSCLLLPTRLAGARIYFFSACSVPSCFALTVCEIMEVVVIRSSR